MELGIHFHFRAAGGHGITINFKSQTSTFKVGKFLVLSFNAQQGSAGESPASSEYLSGQDARAPLYDEGTYLSNVTPWLSQPWVIFKM
jgi:hypothetical protein